MICPWCNKEMVSGVVQSARQFFFTTEEHKIHFAPENKEEITLSKSNWTHPTCLAYHCKDCKRVIIEYDKN